jgi:uncharacterized protein (TIGR02266 family)
MRVADNRAKKSEFRFKIQLAIFYGVDQQTLMSNYSVNLSTGGIFLESSAPLPVDTLLVVEFVLPINSRLIVCKARVAWVNRPEAMAKPSLPAGMGIQFLDLSLENVQVIRKFLGKFDLVPTW